MDRLIKEASKYFFGDINSSHVFPILFCERVGKESNRGNELREGLKKKLFLETVQALVHASQWKHMISVYSPNVWPPSRFF